MIRFLVQLKTKPGRTADEKGQGFIKILIISVTLVVVAVPEGLPLAVTLALAFATKRMTKENLLVRVLASCETMASTSVICTDKTGTLTTNNMAVVSASFVDRQVVRDIAEHPRRIHTSAGDEATNEEALAADHMRPALNLADLKDNISHELADLINMSVALNSTAFEQTDKETGKVSFIGSKTECALLELCAEQGWTSAKDLRDANPPTHIFPFSSMQKSSGAVIPLPNGQYRLLIKGASEIVLGMANKYVVTTAESGLPTETLDAEVKHSIEETIVFYAKQSLRTIGLAYRDVPQWPPANWVPANEEEQEAGPPFALLTDNLTFIGVTAIEDVSPLQHMSWHLLTRLLSPSEVVSSRPSSTASVPVSRSRCALVTTSLPLPLSPSNAVSSSPTLSSSKALLSESSPSLNDSNWLPPSPSWLDLLRKTSESWSTLL
jgi:Ca2+-transporting ATPase